MLINRKRFSSSLDSELNSELHELSKETRIPISKLFDEAISLLLNKHSKGEKLLDNVDSKERADSYYI